MRRRLRRWLTTLWPGFFAAAVLQLGVFAVVDPGSLHAVADWPLVAQHGEVNRMAVQTLAFFFFWAVVSSAIATARWLDTPARQRASDRATG